MHLFICHSNLSLQLAWPPVSYFQYGESWFLGVGDHSELCQPAYVNQQQIGSAPRTSGWEPLKRTSSSPCWGFIYQNCVLYPPSKRSETGGYTVFTFVCLCVSVSTPVFNSVSLPQLISCLPHATHHPPQPISLPKPNPVSILISILFSWQSHKKRLDYCYVTANSSKTVQSKL